MEVDRNAPEFSTFIFNEESKVPTKLPSQALTKLQNVVQNSIQLNTQQLSVPPFTNQFVCATSSSGVSGNVAPSSSAGGRRNFVPYGNFNQAPDQAIPQTAHHIYVDNHIEHGSVDQSQGSDVAQPRPSQTEIMQAFQKVRHSAMEHDSQNRHYQAYTHPQVFNIFPGSADYYSKASYMAQKEIYGSPVFNSDFSVPSHPNVSSSGGNIPVIHAHAASPFIVNSPANYHASFQAPRRIMHGKYQQYMDPSGHLIRQYHGPTNIPGANSYLSGAVPNHYAMHVINSQGDPGVYAPENVSDTDVRTLSHDESAEVVYVRNACIGCKKSHTACDTARPCNRCVRLNRTHLCIDSERKKRGRPPKAEDGDEGNSNKRPKSN